MKIGIITTYQSFRTNYGAVLQAYALSRQLQILGYEPYIMPYIAESEVKRIESYSNRNQSKFKIMLNRISHAFNYKVVRQHFANKKQERLKRAFDRFNTKYLPLYQTETMSVKQLSSVVDDFFAFVCGSDQVWSTKLQGNCCDRGMFLKFVPDGIKRIAYAPSMGSSCVSSDVDEDLRSSLSKFDAISIREKQGAAFLFGIIGMQIPVVLDPTMLLPPDEWDAIIQKPYNVPKKYILVYRFGNSEDTLNAILKLSEKLDLPIIELPSSYVSLNDNLNKMYDIGPDHFIWLIRNATLVCTDSFHATVFSIINHTPFLTFYRQDPNKVKENMNARVEELLELTGLSDRLISPGQAIVDQKIFDLDFDTADHEIEEKRSKSLAYLTNALK
jgi:hypothetical protein